MFLSTMCLWLLGWPPNFNWLKGTIELDKEGFLKINYSTSKIQPVVFIAGDVSINAWKQAIAELVDGEKDDIYA